jgi:hypothetical protein
MGQNFNRWQWVACPAFTFKSQTSDCPGEKHSWNHQLIIQEVAENIGISLVHSTWFKQKTQNLLDPSKICGKTPDWWSEISSKQQMTIKTIGHCNYWWWGMGLWLWNWNQTTIITLEEPCYTLPHKSIIGAIKSRSYAARFFIIEALCIIN